MEGYEFLIIIPVVVLGAYFRGFIYDNKMGTVEIKTGNTRKKTSIKGKD